MRDLIDDIKAVATADEQTKIDTFVTEWLLTKACPADYATRCGMHQ